MNTKRIAELREQLDDTIQEAARLEGVVAELKRRLYNEFGCRTIKEAKRTCLKLQNQIKRIDAEIDHEADQIESTLRDLDEISQ